MEGQYIVYCVYIFCQANLALQNVQYEIKKTDDNTESCTECSLSYFTDKKKPRREKTTITIKIPKTTTKSLRGQRLKHKATATILFQIPKLCCEIFLFNTK